MKRAARLNKTAVRFSLKVKVVSVVLPSVADGSGIFVIVERGKRHKSWTKSHSYVSTGASEKAKLSATEKWAEENLEIPVTLYRGAKGVYQPKPFKIKVMRDPGTSGYVAGTSSDNPHLATFTLDAARFTVIDEHDAAHMVHPPSLF